MTDTTKPAIARRSRTTARRRVDLLGQPISTGPEPCCAPVCQYNPAAIREATNMIALILAGGEDVSEAIRDHLNPHSGYELGRALGTRGPTCEAFWACYVDDIRRAWAAGKKTPEEISVFLCRYSGMGQEDES